MNPLADTTAYYGLYKTHKTDADIVRAAHDRGHDVQMLRSYVLGLRAAATRIKAARATYLAAVGEDLGRFRDVLEADFGYSDVRRGVDESDILELVDRL